MMKTLLFARRWIGIGAAGLLAGCATLGPAPSVALSVTSIVPRESTLLETSADVTLRLTNESAQPLALAGSSHKVYVNDTLVGRGVTNERVTVPAFGTVAIKVAVYADNLVLLRKAKEFSELPKLAYRLESKLHPAEGAGWGDLKAGATGEIDLAAFGLTLTPAAR